ncbi:uncharacterized protein [Montipora capricornis]|uniref:uncharacterized protein n=1 Tax=Montipora capricornis TaxID=246305 RepID=UPI0035F10C0E
MASSFSQPQEHDGSVKVQVTFLASEWGSRKGGLSTINRELAIQLAKFPDVKVTFVLPKCSHESKKEAQCHCISIVEAERLAGYHEELDGLGFPPENLHVDLVVGHGVKLGRQAQVIRKSHKCKWVQVLHIDPEKLGMHKFYENLVSKGGQKHHDEVQLCLMADLVVGVGPKVTEAYCKYLGWCKKSQDVFEFTPGVFADFFSVEKALEERKHLSVLVFGRGDDEDFELKGFDIAGRSVAPLHDTGLVFVGAPDGKEQEIAKRLLDLGIPKGRLTVRGFKEREALKREFCEADLVLMPSRAEGFGLTGLEALSAGLPVIVSKNSGFGEALDSVPFGSSFVIDPEDPSAWTEAIKGIWNKDRQKRFDEAKVLRDSYAKKYSWSGQCEKLLKKMFSLLENEEGAFGRSQLSVQEGVERRSTSIEDITGSSVNDEDIQRGMKKKRNGQDKTGSSLKQTWSLIKSVISYKHSSYGPTAMKDKRDSSVETHVSSKSKQLHYQVSGKFTNKNEASGPYKPYDASGGSQIAVQERVERRGASIEDRTVTPPEINLRGPMALEAYNRALTEGKTRVRRIPIMLIGQDRTGKTSLKKSLQGLRFNPDEDNTVGIDVDPSYFKVTTEIWKIGEKDQAANKEEMAASFEHHVARVVVENLRKQELTSEVKTMNKLKDLESSPTISTEAAQIVSESNEIPEDHQGLSTAIIHDQVGSSADSFLTTGIETEDYAGSSKSSGAAHVVGGSRIFQTTENYPALTTARDNTVSSGMIPKEIETLIKKLRDKVDKVDSEDDIYSVLWDFAGQSVYYETHQLFLTSRAIYLLIYDLSRDPSESAQPVKRRGVFGKIEENSCTKTNLDYLDYWMTSVSSQSSRIKDHDLCSASTSTVLPKTLPPVFLVCTHSDQPFGGNDPSEIAINVYGSLKTKSYGEQLFHDVFKVDNTKSGGQEECAEVKRLRESILAVAMELPQTKEEIPIKWLKYEKALLGVLDEGHTWITIEHAKRIASEVCQIHDDQEFVTVLDFFHDQRIVIHFDDTVELNKLVVLDPQWLIDVFKAVISVKRYDEKESGLKDLWLKLESKGILDEKLLLHAWGQIAEEHDTFESLIAIMEKFSLLCSWSSSNEPCSKEYLVPSMLRWYPPQEITKLITSARLPSLFVKFESGQVPSNLFPRLVVQFLQWGRNEFWSRVNPHLYKNFARIYTAEDENYSVVLLCHSSLIEVVVHEGNVRSLKDDLQAVSGNSPGRQRDSFEVFCAREVFRQLVLLLECLRKEFYWLKRMKYQAGIICPVCCHKRLVNYCRTHHKQDCEQEECLHFITESELRNLNQHITCTRSAVAVSNKVYTKEFTAWFASPREETTADANGGRLSCSRRESEDKSVTLPGNVIESLVSPSCDPKEIVLQLKENFHLDQTDLEKPTPETTRMIRCFAETAKDSNQIDVVKHLREITPAGTTGPLLPGKLDICSIPVETIRKLTIDLTVTDWQVVAERVGLRANEIKFLDMRYPNPSEAALTFVAQYHGMNVDYLYDVLTECGMPMLADIL